MLEGRCDVKHLMYQNSGDIDNHDRSRVVGYHSFAFLRKPATDVDFMLTDADKQMLKEVALQSIKDSLDGKRLTKPALNAQLSALNSKCGAFVSLHKQGRLRGCIGHFGEDYPLCEMVARMARAAAFEDPRFSGQGGTRLGRLARCRALRLRSNCLLTDDYGLHDFVRE